MEKLSLLQSQWSRSLSPIVVAGQCDKAMRSMILGKRLATPSYLSAKKKERLVSSCSIKYKAACKLTEVGWWLSAEFIKKETKFCSTLHKTCEQGDSKWKVLDQLQFDRWRKSKRLCAKIYHVDCLQDFVNHIRKLAKVDRFGTSCGVLHTAKK